MSQNPSSNNLVWIDCEMTGLNAEVEKIIEIACIVTDQHLNVLEKTDNIIIHQDKALLDRMNDWCKQHHGASGLTAKVLQSTVTTKQAEDLMLEMVKKYCTPKTCPLAGNSVHADKMFLVKEMPNLTEYLHYRIVDVSTIKELCKRWYPDEFLASPKKKETHRALDDILESLQELKYYKSAVFK